MKQIPLSKGHFVSVDDEDFEALISIGTWTYSGGYAFHWYTDVSGKRRGLWLHRIVAERMFGSLAGMQVDHINADRLDATRANLRLATASENQSAKRIVQRNNTSGHKGVTLRAGKFDVRLRYYHHRLHLGRYADFDLAVAVYGYAHRILWQEFTSEGQGDVQLLPTIQDKLDEQIATVLKTDIPRL